ncbi:30S ribosomal protein S30 [Pseudomaricurvus alkylphenolicus]|jgi:ribosomal subunit interface protein|uniref:HPF/RaiA family ribosome-associated protein n=1 Tax=Pseudomaricurvus alkylphenolicus TaxID=1306991 RepID=UPI0014234A84|nr:HPF/RaiA family ribosome-associated protein [Pseudomaricurvus alkylphenolicus]NIB43849.1 30S ribosomal protein S30 [Pseudomaricurvus alkylphenolicus]
MQSTNTVIYRDLDASQALTSVIDKKLEKLKRFSSQISSSRVVLDSPHQHKHKGKLYRAQIELGVKGNAITLHQDSTSIHIAVRDVFKAAERKLKEVSGKKQHKHVRYETATEEDSIH